MTNILISGEVEKTLRAEVPACKSDFNVISGFCKLSTLTFLDNLCNEGVKKRLLVRFLPSDIASGATDKEIFNFCKQHGWIMYIDYSIHAKTYIFDKVKCILGSANATNKGIGAIETCNKEASAHFKLDNEQYKKVMTLYQDALLLDDKLYNDIISQVDDNDVINKIEQKKRHKEPIKCLMPEDFPDGSADIIELHNCKAYKWLKMYLENKDERFAYFGELSSVIHDIFIKEPRRFRKDIKYYLRNLLDSIINNQDGSITVVRPNYSEKIILTS